MHQPDFAPIPHRLASAPLAFHARWLRLTGLSVLLLGIIALGGFGHSAAAQAVEATVFGPETFKRETGKPQLVVQSFVADPANSFTLVIENGAKARTGFPARGLPERCSDRRPRAIGPSP